MDAVVVDGKQVAVNLESVVVAVRALRTALEPITRLMPSLNGIHADGYATSADYANALAEAIKEHASDTQIAAFAAARKALYRAVNPHVRHEE